MSSMQIKSRILKPIQIVCIAFGICAGWLNAQEPGKEANAGRILGAVTKIDADTRQLVLKTDAGAEIAVSLDARVTFRRVAPGETSLANAAPITIGDVHVGDRVLARGKAGEDAKSITATQVVVMSQSDIASKQAADRADWDRRGAQGVVIDAKPDQVTINVRTISGVTPLIIKSAPNAVVRRYTPDSVKFADAKVSSLDAIKKGDQVRARGNKTPDGLTLNADEIVSGQFAMIAGLVLSVDAKTNPIRINNITTKKPMTVKIIADSSVKKLPAPMAQMIANRLHGVEEPGGPPGGPGGVGGPGAGGPGAGRGMPPGGMPAGMPPGGIPGAMPGGMPGGGRGGFGGGRPGDLQQMIERIPSITLADLLPGEAVIISSTVGATADQITAISLLAGVEPILTKPGTREMSLDGGNFGGGGGGGGGDLGGLGGFGQ